MKTNTVRIGIQVARLMNRGLVHEARLLARGRNCWQVVEVRAILGVGRAMTLRGWCDGNSVALSVLGWQSLTHC